MMNLGNFTRVLSCLVAGIGSMVPAVAQNAAFPEENAGLQEVPSH